MKFTQEEIKKVVLAGLFVSVGIYLYFSQLLGPLDFREKAAKTRIADLEPKIRNAQAEIKRIEALSGKVPWAEEVMAEVRGMIPPGAPVAWFPPRIVSRFERHNIKGASVRLLGEEAVPELPGFNRLSWAVTLPKITVADLGFALAGIESEELLVKVTGLTIRAGSSVEGGRPGSGGEEPQSPEFQSATLNLKSLVKK
jgi:hypothetical protein